MPRHDFFAAVERAIKLLISSVADVKPRDAPYRSPAHTVFSWHGQYNDVLAMDVSRFFVPYNQGMPQLPVSFKLHRDIHPAPPFQ